VLTCGKLCYQNRLGEEVGDRSEFAPILLGCFLVSFHQWFRGECLIKEKAKLSVVLKSMRNVYANEHLLS